MKWFKTSFGCYIKIEEINCICPYWYDDIKIKYAISIKNMNGYIHLSEEDYNKIKKILNIK